MTLSQQVVFDLFVIYLHININNIRMLINNAAGRLFMKEKKVQLELIKLFLLIHKQRN